MGKIKHLGLIIDGNRRHAKKYGMSLREAYQIGAMKGRLVLDWIFVDLGIPQLSAYALSHDNLTRPFVQLSPIFQVQATEYEKWASDPFFEANSVKVSFHGDFGNLPQYYVDSCKKIMEKTKGYGSKKLNILVGYNGQREIAGAVRKWLDGHKGKSVDQLVGELDSADAPSNGVGLLRKKLHENMGIQSPLDLVIRTGRGLRNSGFLTWQGEYAELYSTPKLWPEVTKEDIVTAIKEFQTKNRSRGR